MVRGEICVTEKVWKVKGSTPPSHCTASHILYLDHKTMMLKNSSLRSSTASRCVCLHTCLHSAHAVNRHHHRLKLCVAHTFCCADLSCYLACTPRSAACRPARLLSVRPRAQAATVGDLQKFGERLCVSAWISNQHACIRDVILPFVLML